MSDAPTNSFPSLGINTRELIEWVEMMLAKAAEDKGDFGAVNWGDLGISDIEYRYSMLHPSMSPHCVVTIEEASPSCPLASWLFGHIDKAKFPHVYFECEW